MDSQAIGPQLGRMEATAAMAALTAEHRAGRGFVAVAMKIVWLCQRFSPDYLVFYIALATKNRLAPPAIFP